jgi:hypothetical protein
MALLYVLCAVAGAAVAFFRRFLAEGSKGEYEEPFLLAYGLLLMLLGLGLCAVFAASLFLPPRPWVWVYDLVLIALGLSSPCCIAASLPLLIYWIKDDTRRYFGRT